MPDHSIAVALATMIPVNATRVYLGGGGGGVGTHYSGKTEKSMCNIFVLHRQYICIAWAYKTTSWCSTLCPITPTAPVEL